MLAAEALNIERERERERETGTEVTRDCFVVPYVKTRG